MDDDQNPRLWNPLIVAIASFLLGYVFGSALIALNWHALRKHFWATLVWGFAIGYAFLVQEPLLSMVRGLWPYLIGFAVWFPIVGLSQWQYLRKEFPLGYRTRPWLLPICIGMAAQIVVVIWVAQQSITSAPPPTSATTVAQKEYTAEELNELVGPSVVEVQTRWREPHLLFFHRENGADGTAVLLRIRSDGVYFATNRHVIEPPTESDSYSCAIAIDGSRYQVEEIACRTDGLDLALLRFASRQAEGEFEMPIQPLSRIHVGQACIAIGNALGAGRSVTSGVVSRIDVIGNKPTIRTSAAISPGNSGGGLFSLNGGYLIGITSATVTAESAQNVNLAIPADALLDDKWQTFQKVSR